VKKSKDMAFVYLHFPYNLPSGCNRSGGQTRTVQIGRYFYYSGKQQPQAAKKGGECGYGERA
jgi:hypothetical protein